jgi:enamine deaminase RidA (YjgF/YER057c/UK114 family)
LPPGRAGTAVAPEPVGGKVVLFGGAKLSDIWEQNGRGWMLVPIGVAPDDRETHVLAGEHGAHARSAVDMAELPFGASVEIEEGVEIERRN